MKNEIMKILFLKWKDNQGERRYLFLLISLLISTSGGLIVYFVTKYCSYLFYQVFMFIVVMVFAFLAVFVAYQNRNPENKND
jgi:FtsH-binding integral membrane protein